MILSLWDHEKPKKVTKFVMLPKQEFESSEVKSFIRAGVILAREYAHFLALPASRNQGPQKTSVSVSNAGEEHEKEHYEYNGP